jgi:hypothetical protein
MARAVKMLDVGGIGAGKPHYQNFGGLLKTLNFAARCAIGAKKIAKKSPSPKQI